MSLLPGRILPQTEPFGTLSEDGKTVIIDKNWWLLFYNMALQSIGTGTGIPADQLIDLESVDIDAVGSDTVVSNAAIGALTNLLPSDGDPVPSLQDVKNALLLAYSALDAVDAIVSGFASPTAKVGLTAVPGVALTAMRSDAAPPIDLTITATWTNLHTFTGGISVSGATNPLLVQGGANQYTAILTGNSTSGQSFGLRVNAGTTTADVAFQVNNQSAGTTFLLIGGTGKASFNTAIGWNGAAPPAQVTGFGSPVGGAVVASYNITDAGGANSNTNKCVAEILTIMKAHGMIGA